MKYFSLLLLAVLLCFSSLKAQGNNRKHLDSLYTAFINFHNHTGIWEQHRGIQSIDTGYIKCAFGIVNNVKHNLHNFLPQQQKVLTGILQRPTSDTSFVSPNGFFRIHFLKSSFPDYVPNNIREALTPAQLENYKKIYLDSLAIALDSAYNFEVNYLGYPAPPPDNGMGGDNKYDIYITYLGDTYGYTEQEDIIPGTNRYTSFMVIDNSFSNFYTTRIYAARVTVAHEFHHSIQMGDYILRYDTDEYFYELTSTSMEHFVYPSIHDYYQYLPTYFRNTQYCFTVNGGTQEYALAIWNIFLKDKFGYDIIKKQWELMPKMRAINAIAGSLTDYNTSFGTEFNDFGIWTYFTNYRADKGKYFENAKDYPIISPVKIIDFNASSTNVSGYTNPLTNTFITFVNSSTLDTLTTIITNADLHKSIDSSSEFLSYGYNLSTTQNNGFNKITNQYYFDFSAKQPAFWLNGSILNNIVIENGQTGEDNSDFVYPSPFSYAKNYKIYLPVKPNPSGYAELDVYSIAMKLVYSESKKINISNTGRKILEWNALGNNNAKLASGVYIYVIKSGDNVSKGKLVIFNE